MADSSKQVRKARILLRIGWVLLGLWFAHLAWRLLRWSLWLSVPLGATGLLATDYYQNTTRSEHWFILGWLALESFVISLGMHLAVRWGRAVNTGG